MADNKLKNLTMTQQEYQSLAKKAEPSRPVFKNCIMAFIVGGIVCFIGEAVTKMFISWFGFTEKTAGNPTVAVMILLFCYPHQLRSL